MKKIILLLVLSILFVHYSCENDLDDIIEESENHSHSKNPIKKKEIISYKTFLEINKETKLSKEFDNIFFKKSNNTINIDTTEIVSITTDYQVTYTFKVNEDSLTNGFRNIIIQSTPNNNRFFLVEYPPNFNQSTNNEGLQVKVKQISENNINVKHSESLCIAIFECSEGMHTASNQEEWHECVATKKPAYALVPCGGVSTGGPSGEDPRGGMNEGIPTDPLDGQGNNSNYSSANVLAQYINLSTIEINWLIENPNISNKFLQLLSANGYSNQSKDFIKWAIDYLNVNYQAKNYFNQNPQDLDVLFALGSDFFNQNPNISWDYLENWFFKKQIETENHPVVDPNLITFDTPVQQSSLPSFNTFLNNFPKKGSSPNYTELPTSEAYKLAGGSLWDSHLNQRDAYNNACAIRGSRGLLYSGFDIPVLRYNGTQRTQKGGDGKNYILDAVSFNKFMIQKFGDTPHKLEGADANDPKKVADLLKNKNGIYVIINDKYPSQIHYSGHVDTIINGKCIGGAYTTPNGGVKSIRIWVLN
ncbi:type VI secretion system amidase effector protein Tae4 [Weeksella sp. HMSC059D05]|uniref:type VI secretion system amidase effector protein Tae4 n=1 Tax=Weeksella sp. HMSC059D05 TaxID=1715139 RepID=UPI0008A22708|nr:type VI secretion system amidase effector protein Tae4 [Weeksella sp. HMSC059D05]OFM83843.1 hypothetical protein HMPREF2660_09975 [Weeksella sp. HMSC059D05]